MAAALAGTRGVAADDRTPYGIDPTFGDGGFVNSSRFNAFDGPNPAAAVDSQGRIVVLGTEVRPASDPFSDNLVLRFLADGRPDPSFGVAGAVSIEREPDYVFPSGEVRRTGLFRALAVDPSGRIVLVRSARDDARSLEDREVVVRRLLADGSLDTSFGDGGRVALPAPDQLIFFGTAPVTTDASGNVILAYTVLGSGSPARPTVRVVRWTPEGQLDSEFGDGGFATLPATYTCWPSSIALDAEGRIVVGGGIDYFHDTPKYVLVEPRILLARLLPDGTPDDSFDASSVDVFDHGERGDVFSISFDSEQRLVLDTNGATRRYGADGGEDLTFPLQAIDGVGAVAAVGDRGIVASSVSSGGSLVHLAEDAVRENSRIATPIPGWQNSGGVGFPGLVPAPDGSVVAVGRVSVSGLVLVKLVQGGLTGGPDLEPSDGVGTARRRKISGSFTVTDNGAAAGPSTARVALSDDAIADPSDTPVARIRVGRIDAHGSRVVRFRFTLPRRTKLDGRHVLVELDAKQHLGEAWRFNNVFEVNFQAK
jgi:uncharacterized delta-60 repeat protein